MNVAERKISAGLAKAAEYHQKGMSPDDAVIKVAEEEHLNPEMVRRVVEKFNIIKTNSSIDSMSDKTASFQLANAGVILQSVFQKGALAIQESSSPASQPEVDRLVIERPEPKAAAFFTPEKSTLTVREWINQVSCLTQENNDKLAALSLDCMQHESDCTTAIRGLIDYFERSENMGKFAQFEREALSNYGKKARRPLDIIHQKVGLQQPRFTSEIKLGAVFVQPSPAHDFLDSFAESTRLYCAAAAEKQKVARELQDNIQQFDGKLRQLFGVEKIGRRAEDLIDFEQAERKQAFIGPIKLHEATTEGATSALGSQFQAAHEHALKQKVVGPRDQTDIEKDNIKRQAILANLLSNDEILSRADPHGVQNAYNAILHIAPDATLNHGMMQAFLRSAVAEQAVDPFVATQLADFQNKVLKNKELAKGKVPSAGL